MFADADLLRGATEGLRAGEGSEDWSVVLLGGSLGGFGLSTVSAGLAADADSLRGVVGEGAVESACLTAAVDALRGAREGFRSGLASVALVPGTDAFRGTVEGLRSVEGAGDSAGLVVGVEALLGARDGLRSGAALLGLAAALDVLGAA